MFCAFVYQTKRKSLAGKETLCEGAGKYVCVWDIYSMQKKIRLSNCCASKQQWIVQAANKVVTRYVLFLGEIYKISVGPQKKTCCKRLQYKYTLEQNNDTFGQTQDEKKRKQNKL